MVRESHIASGEKAYEWGAEHDLHYTLIAIVVWRFTTCHLSLIMQWSNLKRTPAFNSRALISVVSVRSV